MEKQDSSNERFSIHELRNTKLTSLLPNTFSEVVGNNYSVPKNDNKINEKFDYGKKDTNTKFDEKYILEEVISQLASLN